MARTAHPFPASDTAFGYAAGFDGGPIRLTVGRYWPSTTRHMRGLLTGIARLQDPLPPEQALRRLLFQACIEDYRDRHALELGLNRCSAIIEDGVMRLMMKKGRRMVDYDSYDVRHGSYSFASLRGMLATTRMTWDQAAVQLAGPFRSGGMSRRLHSITVPYLRPEVALGALLHGIATRGEETYGSSWEPPDEEEEGRPRPLTAIRRESALFIPLGFEDA